MSRRKAVNVRKDFYTASAPECSRETDVFKPAVTLEVKSGVSGVAHYYDFPDDMSASEYEVSSIDMLSRGYGCYESFIDNDWQIIPRQPFDPDVLKELQDKWSELVSLNPALLDVELNTAEPLSLADAISGVACLLNVTDINFFVALRAQTGSWNSTHMARQIPGYEELYDTVCSLVPDPDDDYPGWIPAPETLEEIIRQLDPDSLYEQRPKALRP